MILHAIDRLIDERSLLKHSFYTRWVQGTLPREALTEYARQYYRFESAFPRMLSAIHSQLPELADRQVVLENLVDEERGESSHVELWLRFAETVGARRSDVVSSKPSESTEALVGTYMDLARTSAPTGLAALYAYERQVPAVAEAKLDGLQRNYGISDGPGLDFWKVHAWLDTEHAGAEAKLLQKHADERAIEAAATALDAWWEFLTGVESAAG